VNNLQPETENKYQGVCLQHENHVTTPHPPYSYTEC